jgi:hypothetical protein
MDLEGSGAGARTYSLSNHLVIVLHLDVDRRGGDRRQ